MELTSFQFDTILKEAFAPIVTPTCDQPHKVLLLVAMCGMIPPKETHPRTCFTLCLVVAARKSERLGERRNLLAADCLMVCHMIFEKCLVGSGFDNQCVWCIKT